MARIMRPVFSALKKIWARVSMISGHVFLKENAGVHFLLNPKNQETA
jgi:hypothetical protein